MSTLYIFTFLGLVVAGFIEAAYPPSFHNQDNCLYTYMEDGYYSISFPESEPQRGLLTKITYDKRTKCTKELEPGLLVVVFNMNDNNMESMTLEMQVKQSPSEGYWEVDKATLKIAPVNSNTFPSTTIELKPVDIYAGQTFSYSCNHLILQNLVLNKNEPQFQLHLKRFQLQPFKELEKVIFAHSYDCSVWLTLPIVMGLLLILFITFTVMVGVYLMLELGNQNGDLKFSKQGGMLMNQAQLDATKG